MVKIVPRLPKEPQRTLSIMSFTFTSNHCCYPNYGWWSQFIFALLLVITKCNAGEFIDNKAITSYILNVIQDFQKNPTDGKFQSVITPPLQGSSKTDFFLPKVFVWSPQEQFPDCVVKCPAHNVPLVAWKFNTGESGMKDRMPRLIFDLFGNVLLVQRIYLCKKRGHQHKIVSSSNDLLNSLPRHIQAIFPITMFSRSGCTNALLDFINSNLIRGTNFLQICEEIAELNYRHFCRRGLVYASARNENKVTGEPFSEVEFYENMLFSFPSNDQISCIFLRDFSNKRELYQAEMNKVTGLAISCDHTFKVSKNIGIVRPGQDQRFVTQFNNLYIIMNEEGRIVNWRLTKSTSFEEIREVLEKFKSRLLNENKNLELICVDDCCKARNKYQSIFENTPVKLDLFHACQRVCKTLLHANHPLKKTFQKEFGLIFREDNDQGEVRLQKTPCKEKILQNLETFLQRWGEAVSSPLTQETLGEIERLKKHILKGCLSGIPPGFGTERNEQLHRLLNRSMLSGATRISVELAVAILTVLFYHYSSRTSLTKHKCNSRIGCTVPIEAHAAQMGNKDEVPTFSLPFKIDTGVSSSSMQEVQEDISTPGTHVSEHSPGTIVVAEEIEEVHTEFVSRAILDASFDLYEVVNNLEAHKHNRAFEVSDVMGLINMPDVITVQSMFSGHEDDITINRHLDILKRNLAAFNLEIEEVCGDGDCAFRSLVKQIHKIGGKDKMFKEHLERLHLMKTEEEDTYQLRQLFVDEILKGDEELLSFLPAGDDIEKQQNKVKEFRSSGVYDQMLGQILQLPVIVITSSEAVSYLPFVPDTLCSKESAFVGFHYYGAGHYDSTKTPEAEKSIPSTEDTTETQKGCSCGRNIKNGERSCVKRTTTGDKRRSCPCVRSKQMCSKKCRCRSCDNKEKGMETFCRCGEGKKKTSNFLSCSDEVGKRKTKCPCFKHGRYCNKKCKYFNCSNGVGKKDCLTPVKRRAKKITSSSPSAKRRRGYEYLKEAGFEVKQGSWTLLETCILHTAESFISSTCISPTTENIFKLYNYVIKHVKSDELKPSANEKTVNQIRAKLEYKKNRQEAMLSFLNSLI